MRARILPLRIIWTLICAGLALCIAQPVLAQGGKAPNNIAAELVAEGPARAGETLQLALHFRPGPGWHGYWSNPGDVGYGMMLDWKLPAGWQAGEPQYPVPHRLLIGGLMNHIYEGDYAVLVPVTVPDGASLVDPVDLEVGAEWLACTDKLCVPEQAVLRAKLPAAGAPNDVRFDTWHAAIPPMLDSEARFDLGPVMLRLAIPVPATFALADPHVFVGEDGLVDYVGAQEFRRKGDLLLVEIPLRGTGDGTDAVSGILKIDDSGNGVRFLARPGDVPAGGQALETGGGAGTSGVGPFWLLALGALAGGLLLNIMPCVFPILSLKALSLARSGESEVQARKEALAYTGGVVLTCLALGGLLLVLRAGGQQLGWAFQLQEPGVVFGLLLLAIAITANLAGLFELPSLSIIRAGEPAGAFATGLLVAFVATPCTGPFMAAALGAALLLAPAQALALFALLGLGLALPFLLLGFVPVLRGLLPRPGAWMEHFRHILTIPMGLTALALVWLCWRLGGAEFALAALALGGFLVLGVWLAGQRQRAGKGAAGLFAGVLTGIAVASTIILPRLYAPTVQAEAGLFGAAPFNEAALARARSSGRPVFLYFTADWCLTCKVNEQVAIEREMTRAAFKKANVQVLRGDWTRRDPAITRFLTAHDAAGVPLYLWYPSGGEGQQLQQILTVGSLVTLAESAPSKPADNR